VVEDHLSGLALFGRAGDLFVYSWHVNGEIYLTSSSSLRGLGQLCLAGSGESMEASGRGAEAPSRVGRFQLSPQLDLQNEGESWATISSYISFKNIYFLLNTSDNWREFIVIAIENLSCFFLVC